MKRFIPLALASALALGIAGPAAANHTPAHNAQGAVQNALVGILVQAIVRDVTVIEISDSLNNLLQNADIDVDVLNNSLNNVLRNVDVTIQDIDITVVGDDLNVIVDLLGAPDLVIVLT